MTLVESLQKDMLSFLSAPTSTAPLLKRVFLFLEDGEFVQADAYCEKILDIEPENALTYLGKLMASRRISSMQELADAQYTIDSDSSFKKAMRFAPIEMQQHLRTLNMQIYSNSIAACRNRAKVHMSHGELKETAQQYHNAMTLWEDSKETLPDAENIYNDLANEVADFNWKLLLHNRQCPDDQQLIARGIPIDTDRWYQSAVKWADNEKRAYFESIAKDTLFNAHLKCMDAIKNKKAKLAQIWADHYKAAASADDPLSDINHALVSTNCFTQFAAEAPNGMLKLIDHYTKVYPQGVEEIKEILQDYYVQIFQTLLDFSGKEPQAPCASAQPDAEAYVAQITQQEACACDPDSAATSVQTDSDPVHIPAIDPVWAMEIAREITGQMADAVSTELSPYGLVSTYLAAAKELTVRYGKRDGIVTDPVLFRFICNYYKDALAHAQGEQVDAIQTKFNDFLTETVQLPSASTEIVSDASGFMQGSTLPYQIYLSRLTNNYSVEMETLIPPHVTEELEKWQRYLDAAKPKRDCYWINDQQSEINAALTAAENAVTQCRQYTDLLQKNLDTPYQAAMTSAGDGKDELASGWTQKMQALQEHCDQWADSLQQNLTQVQTSNSTKLQIARKQIKLKETTQLIFSIIGNIVLLAAILAFAIPLIPAIGFGWSTIQQPTFSASYNQLLFYGVNIGVPVIAGILSMVNAWAAPAYQNKRTSRLLCLFILFGILTYVSMGTVATKLLLDLRFTIIREQWVSCSIAAGILALCSVIRTLLEFALCKMREHSRNRGVKITCHIGGILAKVAGLAQALVCFAAAALFIYSLIIR